MGQRQTPTPDDIPLPGIQGQRPVASYDLSPWNAGAQAMAKGVENLGGGIEKAAKEVAEAEVYQARNSALLAQTNATGEAIQLREKYQPGGEKYNPDPTALQQSYQTDLDQIAEKHLGTIPQGPLRDHARARLQIPFAHEIASVGAEARKRQIGDFRSGIIDEADSLVNTTGAQDDPLHTAKMQQWAQKVHLGLQQGYLTPVEAEQLQRKTARGVIDGEFRARFRSSPESAASALRDLYLAQTGIVGPRATAVFSHVAGVISKAETGDPSLGPKALGNISPDTNGSKSYGFLGLNSGTGSAGTFQTQYGAQFGLTAKPGSNAFDAQWAAASLNQTGPFRAAQLKYLNENILPSVASNLQKAGVPIAAAADPRVSTYFADRAVQMGTVGLSRAGEAWQSSGGDIERFLRNMNAIDAKPENLQSNFASAIATGVYGPKGHATRLQTRLAGALAIGGEGGPPSPAPGQAAGEAPTGNPAYDILTPTHRDTLIREGHTILNGYRVDDERAERAAEKAQKQHYEETEAAIFHDLHGANPSTTAEGLYDLYTGRSLSKEGYERMVNLLETRSKVADKEDHDVKTYGPAFHDLMQRIHPQDGHLAPVTDPGQITDFYIQNPDHLTFAGHEKLVGMINANRKSLDDHAANTTRTGLLNYAKSRLSFEQDTGPIKIRDPKGEAIFNSQFIPKFESGYDAWIKAGKDPWKYLSRENVDDMLKGMRNPHEMNADYLSATGQVTGQPEAPNAPLPPAPEGIEEARWKPVISAPPALAATGQPATRAQWAQALTLLATDPSPQTMAAFDRYFAPAGLTAKDLLGKLNPAAAKAAEMTGGVGVGPTPAAPAAPAPSYSIHDTSGPGPAGYLGNVLRAVTPQSVQDYLKEKGGRTEPAAVAPQAREEIERQIADLDRQARAETNRPRRERIEKNRDLLKKQLEAPALDHDAHAGWRDGR